MTWQTIEQQNQQRRDTERLLQIEALAVVLARSFRTFLLDRATTEQRDPQVDINLMALNEVLMPFDQRDFGLADTGGVQFHMLGNPAYTFKPEGDE